MSDVIRLLPDSVANQIAAGEVIQRPSSVVKELVENAVDAGAQSIKIIIRDAGRTLIQVVDDGCGMTETDARLAFERHATSKIEHAADLFSLHTMGFRGEALASIAAVAQVDLRTMPHGAELGTRIVISGSKVESQGPEACAPGSNMMVKNLFFNVPARRKFLKKDAVELANILREFERLALVNPQLDFELVSNDADIRKLMRASFKQRIADLFGRGLDKQLLPVKTSTSIVEIEGFVCRPEFARRRNQLQYLMVNGRHMRHLYFHKAIMRCYEQLISADVQPNYFINFKVDPQTIDVNIHPTKNEIKFENEAAIFQILEAAVRESLGSFNAVPSIDFDSNGEGEIYIPVFNPDGSRRLATVDDPEYNPFTASRKPTNGGAMRPSTTVGGMPSSLRNWEQLYQGFTEASGGAGIDKRAASRPSLPGISASVDDESVDADGAVATDFSSFQLKARFIVTPSKSGLMVVEQHRAHELVLYHRYMDMLVHGEASGQKVMFPEVVRLSPSQSSRLKSMQEDLASLGLEVSFLGDDSWSVNSIPSNIPDTNVTDLVLRLVDDAAGWSCEKGNEEARRHLALSMASSTAIPAGRELNTQEREHLLEELFRLPSPGYTPSGKLIVSIIPLSKIADLF